MGEKSNKKVMNELEGEMKEMLFDKYSYLKNEYNEKDLFLYWDNLEHLKDTSHKYTKDFLNIITIPVVKVSDNNPIGLLVFKFKSTDAVTEKGLTMNIVKSSLQFISMK